MPRKPDPNATPRARPRTASSLKISSLRLRAYSIVKHVGRRSAREYLNPASGYPRVTDS